ncbi:MAG TPA: hypothetical protein VFF17_12885 [Thermoanaerobaculia bacterium]|nr:hypothetical protein [Thermoanaerobaculia bacterium]
MSSAPPPRLTLEEARARLRELGYLRGGVERFVFGRGLGGGAGPVLPVLAVGIFSLALAAAAAVASSQFRYGGSLGAIGLLFVHLLLPALLPAVGFAALLLAAAGRSRRPGRGAAVFGFAAAAGVLLLWLLATWRLGAERPEAALLWGLPVALAALLFGATARAAYLARAFARSGRLPERRRRAILLVAAASSLAIAALLFSSQREAAPAAPPLPSPRSGSVVVVAIDGLGAGGGRGGAGDRFGSLFDRGATGWWPARSGSPAEIWTDLATGVPASRHGVRALEWVRPLGLPPMRPPLGTSWYFRGVGIRLGVVESAPVSARERRSLAFWEVAASAGLQTAAVGWWASGPWPGAAVVENRELLSRAADGRDVDRVAIAAFDAVAPGRSLAAVYLPSLDILRGDAEGRAAAAARLVPFVASLEARARRGEIALVVIAADSHPGSGSLGRMAVFDGVSRRTVRIRPEDVAPSILARAGVPVAEDLPGGPAAALFRPGSLERTEVATYGERIAPALEPRRETDREYLEKLKSLGYLN